MTSSQRRIASRFRVSIGITFAMLTGCAYNGSGTVNPSTPTETLSPSESTYHAPPWQALVDAQDPCSLIDVKQIPQLRRLVGTKTKRESYSHKKACTWRKEDSRGTSILRVSTFDLRPQTEVPIPRDYSLDCPPYQGSAISIKNRKFCLHNDRQSLKIMYHNIAISIIWATTEISLTQSEVKRVRQENQLSRQLAEQAFQNLGM